MKNWKDIFPQNNRYFETQNGILYYSDCFELLHKIPSQSISTVATDPPYNIGYTDWDGSIPYDTLFKEIKRITKQSANIFLFSGWSNVCHVIEYSKEHLFLKDWIIYDRIKGRGTRKSLVSTREDLLWFVKDKNNYTFHKPLAYSTIKKKTGGMGNKNNKDVRALSNVWTDISPIVPWSKERVNHPTQKPVAIFNRILTVFSNPNDIVLDMFCGSGTTAVACESNNRRWICIEKDINSCEITKQRLMINQKS